MSEDVYAAPDLTKKVRYRRERERETEDRGEREERVVDIYASADDPGTQREDRGEREERLVDIYASADDPDPHPDPDPGTQQRNTATQREGSEESKKNRTRAVAVCLGVLLILLAAITGLVIYSSKMVKDLTEQNVKIQSDLTEQNKQFQFRYGNLTKHNDDLQSRYGNLTKQKAQLQTDYDNLTNQKNQIQSYYNGVTAERDELKRKLCVSCGWQTSGSGCYYVSTEEKTWEQSRQDCVDRESDLIIINSKKEQDFVKSVVSRNQRVWLGLTDREEEGVWKWVDGTPLTSPTYWGRGEPSGTTTLLDTLVSGRVEEDCVEYWNRANNAGLNDASCSLTKPWICERHF